MSVSLPPSRPADRQSPAPVDRRFTYAPAVGPRLRKLLWVVFGLVAVLGANSLYLAAITIIEAASQRWGDALIYQNYFYHWMFLMHLVVGLVLTVPLLAFAFTHLWSARHRPNRRAVRMGVLLLAAVLVLLGSGLALMRVEGFIDVRSPAARDVAYWLHVAAPLACLWLYVLHRLAGPAIRWRLGGAYGAAVVVLVGCMVLLHTQDPRQWNVAGPKEGEQYFFPSLARTATGNFIPSRVLMMDRYCRDCHADAHRDWARSAHRFSSFNNPAYLFSVRETRKVALDRDGTVKASRFCAGCHDPVPFFSGAFDDPKYDIVNDPTAHAGITCTVCHAITHVEDPPRGNASFTIEEPQHYPFAFSENPILRFINRQLVKAKPALHKRTFLKPLHQSTQFCGACHKVHLPGELTHYKDWLRGQNHYDSHLLSGVSGHGASSFYYPKQAETNCNGCHMPLLASNDFGARLLPGTDRPSIHNHLFPAANTAIGHWLRDRRAVEVHQEFLRGCVRVDLFGLKHGSTVDSRLTAPLRPEVPTLQPGQTYLLEAVVRTLRLGHDFTQGTADSNEIWVEAIARCGDRVLGRSGGIDDEGAVDPWAYFLNAYVLDRKGNRIDRRNAQDIFTPLYDHQIPPGAAQVVHFRLDVPEGLTQPISVEVRVNYRKFDTTYLKYVFGKDYHNELPITLLASDQVVFPVAGADGDVPQQSSDIPLWQRWNDYGIGLLLEGARSGDRGEFRQAAEAFGQVEALGRYDGPLNLARVHLREGQLKPAAEALQRAAALGSAPRWVLAWFNGLIHKQRGNFQEAADSFRSILEDDYQELRERKFDFSKDYRVLNELGLALFDWAKRETVRGNAQRASELMDQAAATFHRTLELDSENLAAHHNLLLLYEARGDSDRAAVHRRLRDRYRPDEDAAGTVVNDARRHDPAANHAADGIAIYSLHRGGAPGWDFVPPPKAEVDAQK